jgi:hypothetical protein
MNETRRIFFMHIPKTAGSSINDWFGAVFGHGRCAFHLESRREILAQLNLDSYAHIQVATGHFTHPEIRANLSEKEWLVITCLRNPVEHLLSHLRWLKHIGDPNAEIVRRQHSPAIQALASQLHEIALSDVGGIERFIFDETSEARQVFDNCQVRYLLPRIDGVVGRQDVEHALRNLEKVDFVFTLEQAPTALPLVAQCVGVEEARKIQFPHSNPARLREDVDLTNPTVLDFYRWLVRFDASVFLRAKEIGNELVANSDRG